MENLDNQIPENDNNTAYNEDNTVQPVDASQEPEAVPAAEAAEPVQQESAQEEVVVEEPAQSLPVQEETPVYKASPFADGPYVVSQVQMKPRKTKKVACNAKKVWTAVLCGLLAVALVAGSCLATAFALNNSWEDRLENSLQAQKAEFQKLLEGMDSVRDPFDNSGNSNNNDKPVQSVSGNKTPAQVYAENVDTVVMVYCEYKQGSQGVAGYSSGSGFIVSGDGYIVTNAHVVDGASSISVTFYDNTQYVANLVGADTVNDVALLKIEATGLDYAVIGKSNDLIVGDQVVAIGNPLGELTSTLTVGYISAKERDVNTEGNTINMLQTDAAINSGNSGGPLFNMKGEVVGITTAKYSGTTASGAVIEGIGFAIPIDDVYGLLSDLKNYGYITGAYLGVSVADVDAQAAEYFGIPLGAYVVEAVPGYCAAEAGLQAKDVIVGLGEYTVRNVSELTRALRMFKAGDATTLTIYRAGHKMVLKITLDEKPQG